MLLLLWTVSLWRMDRELVRKINPDRRVEQIHGGIIPCPDRTSFRDRHAAVGIDRAPV
jgi:hypothetical protein